MQVGKLFDLFADAQDLCDFFEGVETREQLISRLELLKRQETDDLLACIVALPVSLNNLLTDTLELSPSIDTSGEDEDEGLDKELEEIASHLGDGGEESSETNTSPTENQKANPAGEPQPTESENLLSTVK